jgi:hypothetical protein
MTYVQVPQQSQYTEEICLGNLTGRDPNFFKQLADDLAPLIYPPDPFRLARPARPFEGFIDPQKELFLAGNRQLGVSSMGLAEDNL